MVEQNQISKIVTGKHVVSIHGEKPFPGNKCSARILAGIAHLAPRVKKDIAEKEILLQHIADTWGKNYRSPPMEKKKFDDNLHLLICGGFITQSAHVVDDKEVLHFTLTKKGKTQLDEINTSYQQLLLEESSSPNIQKEAA